MFALAIGLSDQHPKVDPTPGFRQMVEQKVSAMGWCADGYIGGSASGAIFRFQETSLKPDLIQSHVRMVLGAVGVPNETLHFLGLYVGGVFPTEFNFGAEAYRNEGSCNFNIDSSERTRESSICIFPKNYPFGFEYTLNCFEVAASEFLRLMHIVNLVQRAHQLMTRHHNYAGARGQLEKVPGVIPDIMKSVSGHWAALMTPRTKL